MTVTGFRSVHENMMEATASEAGHLEIIQSKCYAWWDIPINVLQTLEFKLTYFNAISDSTNNIWYLLLLK